MNNIRLSIPFVLFLILGTPSPIHSETIEPLPFGNMDSWITRIIKESAILGGHTQTVYAIGPEKRIEGYHPYDPDKGNPWATSNVLAKVCGIVKTSNAVSPGLREGKNKCAVLSTKMEHCKAIGLVNIDVLVSGSIFLGRMFEPIRSTSNPYSKMEMGIAYTKRPTCLQFDYKLHHPNTGIITKSTGTKTTHYPGTDKAEVFILLQYRWEDSKGNLYAKRVGTGREQYVHSTNGWANSHRIKVMYGDITHKEGYKSYMGLIPSEKSYYARNSKGKMVPVREVGWADASATPTHLLVMASSGCGTAYTGTEGMQFSIDNIALVF
ncbi:MAG: PCMD domain-containing protein [Prevotella sp.]|nr:PCMD domain-containing protein [Prevotella sp.]